MFTSTPSIFFMGVWGPDFHGHEFFCNVLLVTLRRHSVPQLEGEPVQSY